MWVVSSLVSFLVMSFCRYFVRSLFLDRVMYVCMYVCITLYSNVVRSFFLTFVI